MTALILAAVSVLVVLALLGVGHLTNELAALRRRHEALVVNVMALQTKLSAATGETPPRRPSRAH